jgi:hypothetical protein
VPEQKTKPTPDSVMEFLNGIENEQKRRDCFTILELMQQVTGEPPVLWGTMVGFGSYHYRYATGHQGDAFRTGFAPRKQNITLYMYLGFDAHRELMEKLGKYKAAKSCLYIKKLEDVDLAVLRELVQRSVAQIQQTYPSQE